MDTGAACARIAVANASLIFCIRIESLCCAALLDTSPIGIGPDGTELSCANTIGESPSATARPEAPISTFVFRFITTSSRSGDVIYHCSLHAMNQLGRSDTQKLLLRLADQVRILRPLYEIVTHVGRYSISSEPLLHLVDSRHFESASCSEYVGFARFSLRRGDGCDFEPFSGYQIPSEPAGRGGRFQECALFPRGC